MLIADDEVSTESGSDRVFSFISRSLACDPVATALGTDLAAMLKLKLEL